MMASAHATRARRGPRATTVRFSFHPPREIKLMTPFLCLLVSAIPTEPVFAVERPSYAPYTPVVAFADDFPALEYTYIEGNYVWRDSDALDDKLNGWEF